MSRFRVIVLDIDGVLHPADVHLAPAGLPAFGPGLNGHYLCENAGVLADMLAGHYDVRVLLSTYWVQVFGYQQTLSMLPGVLRARVIGSCFEPGQYGAGHSQPPRGYQAVAEIRRRGLTQWVALDHDAGVWPAEVNEHLIVTDSALGLAGPARQRLEDWLRKTQGSSG